MGHSAEKDAGRIEALIQQALYNARDETYREADIAEHARRVTRLILNLPIAAPQPEPGAASIHLDFEPPEFDMTGGYGG